MVFRNYLIGVSDREQSLSLLILIFIEFATIRTRSNAASWEPCGLFLYSSQQLAEPFRTIIVLTGRICLRMELNKN